MKHLKTLNYFILGLILAGAGMAAQAAGPGQGYVSLYVGQSEAEADSQGIEFDGDDTSYRIGGGYRVHQNFAVEGYYVDYGEADDTVTYLGVDVDTTADVTAFLFQAVGLFPVNPTIDLYGKAGLAIWDGEVCAENPLVGKFCEDDDGTELVFGVGANFNVGESIALRAEYEMVEFDDIDVDTIMLGLNIGF